MAAMDWVYPAVVGGGIVLSYGALRQLTAGLQKSMDELVRTNREDHRLLFQEIQKETEKRTAEDKDIREKYVTIQQCQWLMQSKGDTRHEV